MRPRDVRKRVGRDSRHRCDGSANLAPTYASIAWGNCNVIDVVGLCVCVYWSKFGARNRTILMRLCLSSTGGGLVLREGDGGTGTIQGAKIYFGAQQDLARRILLYSSFSFLHNSILYVFFDACETLPKFYKALQCAGCFASLASMLPFVPRLTLNRLLHALLRFQRHDAKLRGALRGVGCPAHELAIWSLL